MNRRKKSLKINLIESVSEQYNTCNDKFNKYNKIEVEPVCSEYLKNKVNAKINKNLQFQIENNQVYLIKNNKAIYTADGKKKKNCCDNTAQSAMNINTFSQSSATSNSVRYLQFINFSIHASTLP